MNILIENAESLQYLADNGEWTENADEGRNFGTTQAAFEVAASEPIGKFNIVCCILQKPQLILLKMDQGTGQGASSSVVGATALAPSQPGHSGSPRA